jgi:hypothetical protein
MPAKAQVRAEPYVQQQRRRTLSGAIAERAGGRRFGPGKEGREVYKEWSQISVEIPEGTVPLKRFPLIELLHSKPSTG